VHDAIDNNAPIPHRNLVLVGLMGCGKSTVGRALSKMLAYPLIDTDQHIEKLEKRSIPEIFKIKGESYFRECEGQLVESLIESNVQKHIIATGGGLPTSKKARALLPYLGYVVWLNTDVDTLHERTSRTDTRPLLRTADPKAVLTSLLDTREENYKECSHLKINTKDLAVSDIAHGILESARFYFHERLKNLG
jgi:shikimate kinase